MFLPQLDSLKDRTGVQTVLFVCRSTTDLPLRGISYATEGVEHFMDTVLNVDNGDFIGKMEGFAVQGLQGKPAVFCVRIHVKTLRTFRRSKQSQAAPVPHPLADSY